MRKNWQFGSAVSIGELENNAGKDTKIGMNSINPVKFNCALLLEFHFNVFSINRNVKTIIWLNRGGLLKEFTPGKWQGS